MSLTDDDFREIETFFLPANIQAMSFTPTLVGGTTPGVATWSAGFPVGRFCRIGPICFFTAVYVWAAHTGAGEARYSLPYTTLNVANLNGSFAVRSSSINNAAGYVQAVFRPNTSYFLLTATGDGDVAATILNIEAVGNVVVSGWYFIQD